MLSIFVSIVFTCLVWRQSGAAPNRMVMLRDFTLNTTELEPITEQFGLGSEDGIQRHYIVQFATPISSKAKENVRQLVGHNLTWYIPYGCFVVYTNQRTMI